MKEFSVYISLKTRMTDTARFLSRMKAQGYVLIAIEWYTESVSMHFRPKREQLVG